SPPLSRAKMAGGVELVAPDGFCIDQTSLEARFAVIARCDGLGAPASAGAAPRGLITVSLTQSKPGSLPSAQQIAAETSLQNVSDVEKGDQSVTFRAQGRIPVGGLSPNQWRGVARMGTQTAGIAVYGPERGEIVSASGRRVLTQLITRSIDASAPAKTTVAQRN
ncbi:MAG TPA: hypothetical protein DD939_18060, partial [Sulfitobacter pontiacus]|nr:hypothetical protein [Sulfitobacter pontiacus]